jgi:hypothetical protein
MNVPGLLEHVLRIHATAQELAVFLRQENRDAVSVFIVPDLRIPVLMLPQELMTIMIVRLHWLAALEIASRPGLTETVMVREHVIPAAGRLMLPSAKYAAADQMF